MSFIEDQKWRYATKKFNAEKGVSEGDIEMMKEAIQLTPTSYGLQLFKVLIVENKEVREKLKSVSWGQSQVTEASHLFVFCNFTDVREAHLDEYIQLKAKEQGLNAEKLTGYSQFILGKLEPMTDDQLHNWTAKQTYLALSNLMNVCAELKIDTCPMEGFEASEYNKILGLTDKGMSAAVVCPIGYRSVEDPTQDAKKVRKSLDDLFEVI